MRYRRPRSRRSARSTQCALERALVAKLIGGLGGRAADDRRIQPESVDELEVDRPARAFLVVHLALYRGVRAESGSCSARIFSASG